MAVNPRTPVLIGVGQCVDRWDGGNAGAAPSPLALASLAAARALEDTGAADAVRRGIDRVYAVRTMLDSVPGAPQPFGRCANLPASIADRVGIAPARAIYSVVGGDQPQALVNEAAEEVHAGEARAVLIAGAEATAAMKLAIKKRVALDWSAGVEAPLEDRGTGPELLSAYERANGLGAPTQTYPVFEHALRARLGLGRAEHVALMSELWARFSEVAAAHPYAQFPEARSAAFLATPSRDNYPVADPYLKWHVAQDAVNQGAAVIVTSVGAAAAMGVEPARLVYLHGYAKAVDRPVAARADLSRSPAIALTLARALEAAGRATADITHFDLYSCFPCAVLLAAEALGLDWRTTPATVTGGLPFFGGAGNNYSMHAIATMVDLLRAEPGAFGLVLANGGFLSKEAVGVYSATPVEDWAPVSSAAIQQAIDAAPAPVLLAESGDAVIDSFTVVSTKGAAARASIVAHTGAGRILARVRSGHRATMAALGEGEPIGRTVAIVHEGGSNFIASPSFLDRRFEHVVVERRGHLLEVTLNRPASMNALHSAAHFELHEIWDEFEGDRDLWVAIVTGAGDRAFCSGNDLKVTARGGDMSLPRSGFGGLCTRYDREKPIIAAVNGIAMGGGLEVALACDLIVADERATFALPEVKVGLFAAAGGLQRLTRQIGRKPAMDLILTGRAIDAAEAERLGIVNRVVPAGEALAAARTLADTLLGNSPSAIRASKRVLNAVDEIEAERDAIAASGPVIARLFRSNDLREGVAAFAEKAHTQLDQQLMIAGGDGLDLIKGVKIVDLTSVVFGPYATQILADLGADVIKVEAPGGDALRYSARGAKTVGMAPAFMAMNRGKRGIVLDLKQADDLAVMKGLIADADVFMLNVRGKAAERLGLDYEAVAALNPAIIYAHCVGFGQDGPYADLQAYDDVIQAATGTATLLPRVDGNPRARYLPSLIADKVAGLHGAYAVLAAIIHRMRTGRGQKVEIPMFEAFASFMLSEHLGGLTFDPPVGTVGYQRQIDPDRQPFPTSDGYISIVAYSDDIWPRVFEMLGNPGFLDDERFATPKQRRSSTALFYREMARLTPNFTTAELAAKCHAAHIPAQPVRDLAEVRNDPHLTATGFFQPRAHPTEGDYVEMRPPVRFGAAATDPQGPAPLLDEHGQPIRDAGF